jgi:hypothetical protein
MAYNYKGEVVKVYVNFTDEDHTLEAVPGETYELIVAPDDGLFEEVANKVAKATKTTAEVPTEAPQTAPEAPVEPAN